jgi:transposase
VLAKGAEHYGFIGEVWTTIRVADVIRREFGVRHYPAHVSRILRDTGRPVHKPVRRAAQANEAAITTWREDNHAALNAKPTKKVARSST